MKRFILIALMALFLAAPAQAAPPQGSHQGTTTGTIDCLSGTTTSTTLRDCYLLGGQSILHHPGEFRVINTAETLTSSDCGGIFGVEGTTTVTLPTTDPAAGCKFTFLSEDDSTKTIDPPAGTVIKCGDSVTGDGATITFTDDGDMIALIMDDDQDYQCFGVSLITDITFN